MLTTQRGERYWKGPGRTKFLRAGLHPDLPESGWKVSDHNGSLATWLATEPPVGWVSEVLIWMRGCRLTGPPPDATPIGDDLYVASVPLTRVAVEYLLVEYEYLMLVKRIT